MTPLTAAGIFAAGLGAGTVNTIVGSGSLITFPTLLAAGYTPVVANVSNTIGLVPGTASGAFGYRRELRGQGPRIRYLGLASGLGGVTGAALLLVLPGSVFRAVVPALIVVACVLVAVQPRLTRRMAGRTGPAHAHGGLGLFATVYGTGVYGGYFGAGQGIILMSLLAIFIADDLQRLNATKNVLAMLVNTIAAVIFIALAHVAWGVAGLLAVGSTIGGQIGATVGRRLSPTLLRACIIVVGLTAAVRLTV
ncbi:MAG: sulfite exporter TauE/SafE family protein [Acidimicrobiales bacterium]